MDVKIKPEIDIPLFLHSSSDVSYIYYALILLFLLLSAVILYRKRIKNIFKLITIKRDIKSSTINLKEAAYSLSHTIRHTDITNIKSLTSKDLLEINLLKYKKNYQVNKQVILNILNKLVISTLLGKQK